MRVAFGCATLAAFAAGALLSLPVQAKAQAAPVSVGAAAAPAAVYGKILDGMESEIVGAAEAMPADKYNFAPSGSGNFAGVRTFGQQVKHLAQANYHYFAMMGSKPTIDVKAIGNLTTKDEIIKALQDSFAFGRQAIDTMTPQNAFVVLDAHGNTRAGLATAVLAHSNDHYGQMVEYLRMNGIIPPASRK